MWVFKEALMSHRLRWSCSLSSSYSAAFSFFFFLLLASLHFLCVCCRESGVTVPVSLPQISWAKSFTLYDSGLGSGSDFCRRGKHFELVEELTHCLTSHHTSPAAAADSCGANTGEWKQKLKVAAFTPCVLLKLFQKWQISIITFHNHPR